MIAEYREVKDKMSAVTALATREVTNDYGKVSAWTLKHHTAGFELAGSRARPTDERWSVTTFDRSSGTTHGNSFRTLEAARSVFDSDKPWYRPQVPCGVTHDREMTADLLGDI